MELLPIVNIDINKSKRLIANKYSYYVSFNYNKTILDIVKKLEIRSYLPESKCWEIPEEELNSLCLLLDEINCSYIINDDKDNLDLFANKEPLVRYDQSFVNSLDFKVKPYDFQKEGILFLLNQPNALLADEQGLGKSMQVLNSLVALKKDKNLKHVLIIVGYNSLKLNWLKEINKFTNLKGYILGTRYSKRTGNMRIGSVQDRLDDLDNLDKLDDYFFLITNVETIRYRKVGQYLDKIGRKRTRKLFVFANKINSLCNEGKIGGIVFDEFQVCKNLKSSQTKALLKMKDSPIKIAATGTPIMNKPGDCYPLLKWLDHDTESYFEFSNNYCNKDDYGNILSYKNLDNLNSRIKPLMLRRLKEDVLDLPDKIFINDYLDLEGKQLEFYNKIKMNIRSNLSIIKSKNDLMSILAARQCTSHPYVLDNTIEESIKFERIIQLLEELIPNGRKLIIFSSFARVIKCYYDSLVKLGLQPAMIIGEVNDIDRSNEVDRFQNDPNCKVILGTIGAMGTGLTLTAASTVVFVDEPWNRALKDQACDRAHRIGAKENVIIRTLICHNTIDERIHKIVLDKGDLADMIVDGKIKQFNKLIDYLFDF